MMSQPVQLPIGRNYTAKPITMKALCYFDLVKHFGDVPYGYENNYVDRLFLKFPV